MVRAFFATPDAMRRRFGRQRICWRLLDRARHASVLALVVIAGCAIVPSSRMDECQKLTQSLHSPYRRRLKDRVLALQGQNRDYAERAVDDGRRLTLQDESIERLEHSVQAYQDDRTRLEAAYKQLVVELWGLLDRTARPRMADHLVRRSLLRVSRGPPATDDDAFHIDRSAGSLIEQPLD